jgi:hypothetical protein
MPEDPPLATGRDNVGFLPRPLGLAAGVGAFSMGAVELSDLIARWSAGRSLSLERNSPINEYNAPNDR